MVEVLSVSDPIALNPPNEKQSLGIKGRETGISKGCTIDAYFASEFVIVILL